MEGTKKRGRESAAKAAAAVAAAAEEDELLPMLEDKVGSVALCPPLRSSPPRPASPRLASPLPPPSHSSPPPPHARATTEKQRQLPLQPLQSAQKGARLPVSAAAEAERLARGLVQRRNGAGGTGQGHGGAQLGARPAGVARELHGGEEFDAAGAGATAATAARGGQRLQARSRRRRSKHEQAGALNKSAPSKACKRPCPRPTRVGGWEGGWVGGCVVKSECKGVTLSV